MQIFKKSPGLVEQEVEGETVVLDKAAGLIHQLNPTASDIWRACNGDNTVESIAKQIAEKYDIDTEQARVDVASALEQLEQQNLVQIA